MLHVDPAKKGMAACAGRWKGAMVAVKIIEHSADINSKIEGFRETMVSSNIQHPNVVSPCPLTLSIALHTQDGCITANCRGPNGQHVSERLLRSWLGQRNHVRKAEKALAVQLITYKVITCGQHGMISGQQAGSLDSASGSHGQCPTNLVGQPPKAPLSPLGRTNSDFEEIQVAFSTPTAPACPSSSLCAHLHAAGVRA